MRTHHHRRRRVGVIRLLLLAMMSYNCVHALSSLQGPIHCSSVYSIRTRTIAAQPSRIARKRTTRTRRRIPYLAAAAVVANQGEDSNGANQEENVVPESMDGGLNHYQWTRQTLAIAVPALVGMMADPLLSLMDTMFVGKLMAPQNLAALGACTSIFHLAFNGFRATTTATTSLVANALVAVPATVQNEENDSLLLEEDSDGLSKRPTPTKEAQEVISISLQWGAAMGLLVGGVLLVLGRQALRGMGVGYTSELYAPAHSYLTTRALAAPFVLLITVAEGAFRGFGNTVIPLKASLLGACINLVLDPLLMMAPISLGIRGAAAATALAQLGTASLYLWTLYSLRMIPRHEPLPPSSSSTTKITTATKKNDQSSISSSRQERENYKVNRIKVIGEIVKANVAMILKQGSLLLGWAYATKRATLLGHTKVAAHQVALSLWLVFALVLDGASVAAQVLMARTYNSYKTMHPHDDSGDSDGKTKIRSLTKYMIKFALVQGLASTALIGLMGIMNAPTLFTSCEFTTIELVHLMPHLAWQQVLVSLTLVMEGLAVGANQFNWLAMGTSLATCWSIFTLSRAHTMIQIWSGGIVALFCGRLLTATLGVLHLNFGTFSFLTKTGTTNTTHSTAISTKL